MNRINLGLLRFIVIGCLIALIALVSLAAWKAAPAPKHPTDWAGWSHYQDHPAPPEMVFLGDSITDWWNLAEYFPGRQFVNRGIRGQTTEQMLVRFRKDVIDLHPRTVFILAGTNDLSDLNGPKSTREIEENLESMAELAKLHGIRVEFGSLLPSSQRPPETIVEVNHWIAAYCQSTNSTYVDFFSSFEHHPELLRDGLHPNAEGYRLMATMIH